MATSSDRTPPPFPDIEDMDTETREDSNEHDSDLATADIDVGNANQMLSTVHDVSKPKSASSDNVSDKEPKNESNKATEDIFGMSASSPEAANIPTDDFETEPPSGSFDNPSGEIELMADLDMTGKLIQDDDSIIDTIASDSPDIPSNSKENPTGENISELLSNPAGLSAPSKNDIETETIPVTKPLADVDNFFEDIPEDPVMRPNTNPLDDLFGDIPAALCVQKPLSDASEQSTGDNHSDLLNKPVRTEEKDLFADPPEDIFSGILKEEHEQQSLSTIVDQPVDIFSDILKEEHEQLSLATKQHPSAICDASQDICVEGDSTLNADSGESLDDFENIEVQSVTHEPEITVDDPLVCDTTEHSTGEDLSELLMEPTGTEPKSIVESPENTLSEGKDDTEDTDATEIAASEDVGLGTNDDPCTEDLDDVTEESQMVHPDEKQPDDLISQVVQDKDAQQNTSVNISDSTGKPPVEIEHVTDPDITDDVLQHDNSVTDDVASESQDSKVQESLGVLEPIVCANENAADVTNQSLDQAQSLSEALIPEQHDLFGDPLEDILSDKNEQENNDASKDAGLEGKNVFDDPLSCVDEPLSATPAQSTGDDLSELLIDPTGKEQKSEHHNIFEDRPEQKDLFGDPQEDIFSAILGDKNEQRTATKSVVSKDVSSEAKLSDDLLEEPTTVSSDSHTRDGEEEDIFAEATVELSLESPTIHAERDEHSRASTLASSSISKLEPAISELEEEETADKFDIDVVVTHPEKVGDGMNAYMAYRVSTKTSIPIFKSRNLEVRRRFSDFLGLYDKLSEKLSQNGYIIPPPPEKSILGMTKVKVGKEDASSAEFVEKRRAALERFLQRILSYPTLLQDPDVREFLESEELPKAASTQLFSGAGFLKMIHKYTEAVSKMTIKMDETDVWFGEKLADIEAEEQQLRRLHALVDSMVTHRKDLSSNTAMFAKSIGMLGGSEDNTALSCALGRLADVEDKIEQLHQQQAGNDFFILAELLADYIRLLEAVRGCFDQRMKMWQRWQDAQNMLQRKRELEAKLLWANKPEKLQQAKDEIVEWEEKVTQFERDFERISVTVKKEVLQFEKEKAKDFKSQILKYLHALLHSQQQLMKYWEAFLPEAKAIA